MNTTTAKTPAFACLLSLTLPGLGQVYNGERAKGFGMLIVAMGVVISCLVFDSTSTYLLMALTYLALIVPASIDAYRIANGAKSPFTSEAKWYVLTMIFAVGPFALPLLWQSQRFSKGAKIAWTVLVIAVAVIAVVMVAALGPIIDQFTKNLPKDF